MRVFAHVSDFGHVAKRRRESSSSDTARGSEYPATLASRPSAGPDAPTSSPESARSRGACCERAPSMNESAIDACVYTGCRTSRDRAIDASKATKASSTPVGLIAVAVAIVTDAPKSGGGFLAQLAKLERRPLLQAVRETTRAL